MIRRCLQDFCFLSESPRFGARESPIMGSPFWDVRRCVCSGLSAGIEKGNGSAVAMRSGVQYAASAVSSESNSGDSRVSSGFLMSM